MDLPLRLLPVEERWSCHGCGICCRHVIIPLSAEEHARIRGQEWDKDPTLAGKRLFVRTQLWPPRYRLAHREDGYCVFLSPTGRCRIHERFGAEAKPLVCRMFPYQTVALDKFAYLTLRHNCPSVIRHAGQPLSHQEDEWRPLAEHPRLRPRTTVPPPITIGYRGTWNQFLRATAVVERLLCNPSYPMVRRLVHALLFAQTLDACRLSRLDQQQYIELLRMLEESVPQEAEPLFRDRVPPDAASQFIFRRILLEYLRLHPGFPLKESWQGRLQWAKMALAIARGKGTIPALAPPEVALKFRGGPASCSESVSLAELDRTLAGLHRDILKPLDEYYEAMAISRRFAVNGRRGWPLTDRMRALAASFPAGLAVLRLAAPGRLPNAEDMAAVVVALDRGEGLASLASRTYRRRLRALGRSGQLIRLVIWWAR